MRSTLTALGIIIGVAAVIVMVTLGNGATAGVASVINSLDANTVMLMPGQERSGNNGMRAPAKLFVDADVEALLSEASGVGAVVPMASGAIPVIHGSANWSCTSYGVTNEHLTVRGCLKLRRPPVDCVVGNTPTTPTATALQIRKRRVIRNRYCRLQWKKLLHRRPCEFSHPGEARVHVHRRRRSRRRRKARAVHYPVRPRLTSPRLVNCDDTDLMER